MQWIGREPHTFKQAQERRHFCFFKAFKSARDLYFDLGLHQSLNCETKQHSGEILTECMSTRSRKCISLFSTH